MAELEFEPGFSSVRKADSEEGAPPHSQMTDPQGCSLQSAGQPLQSRMTAPLLRPRASRSLSCVSLCRRSTPVASGSADKTHALTKTHFGVFVLSAECVSTRASTIKMQEPASPFGPPAQLPGPSLQARAALAHPARRASCPRKAAPGAHPQPSFPGFCFSNACLWDTWGLPVIPGSCATAVYGSGP